MCTAMTYGAGGFCFGRTLDSERSYGQQVVITPRNAPLRFRNQGTLQSHYAVVGMARVENGIALYFDGMNEHGLGMAGLNFVGYARYGSPVPDRDNVAHFELISWILGQCATVDEAAELLNRINVTDEAFSDHLPPASLHWMAADRSGAIVVESMAEGLFIRPNPVGVLTNNPPFDQQLLHLSDYLHLSAFPPENRLAPTLQLDRYSRGMGALGLPGDLTSRSRFVRGAFVKLNAPECGTETDRVSQFFRMMESVSQPKGACRLSSGEYETTIYTSCCSANGPTYYYTTYGNHRITAVELKEELREGTELIRYPLISGEQIFRQNGT